MIKALTVDYKILKDCTCSYCGQVAEWIPINETGSEGYFTCLGCDSYNWDAENGLLDFEYEQDDSFMD